MAQIRDTVSIECRMSGISRTLAKIHPISWFNGASILGNSAMMSLSLRPLSLENNGSAARNRSLAILLHCWQHCPSVILEPNRIFYRKTCNDIDCHVFLLHRVIDDFAVRSP